MRAESKAFVVILMVIGFSSKAWAEQNFQAIDNYIDENFQILQARKKKDSPVESSAVEALLRRVNKASGLLERQSRADASPRAKAGLGGGRRRNRGRSDDINIITKIYQKESFKKRVAGLQDTCCDVMENADLLQLLKSTNLQSGRRRSGGGMRKGGMGMNGRRRSGMRRENQPSQNR